MILPSESSESESGVIIVGICFSIGWILNVLTIVGFSLFSDPNCDIDLTREFEFAFKEL